ncbi:unnamed protein product [Amaranthus hypochondriacus]
MNNQEVSKPVLEKAVNEEAGQPGEVEDFPLLMKNQTTATPPPPSYFEAPIDIVAQKLTVECADDMDCPAGLIVETHENSREKSDAKQEAGVGMDTMAGRKDPDQDEEVWTPVAPSKIARRGQQLPLNRNNIVRGFETQFEDDRMAVDIITAASTDQHRDENPQIPSPQ